MYVYIHLDEVFFENHPSEGKGKVKQKKKGGRNEEETK